MKNKSWLLSASLIALKFFAAAGDAQADPLVIVNNAANGSGPLQTFDFGAGGAQVGSFVPSGSLNQNGRGIAVAGNEVFYTELGGTSPFPTDAIHVAPFNGGTGGADIRTIPNPAPGNGISALEFSGGDLFALTGYPLGAAAPLQVWRLDPVTGSVLGSPVTILNGSGGPHNVTADGFTVLPNGNYLINLADASVTYEEINSLTGMPTGFSLVVPHATRATGVDTDGTHLFFAADRFQLSHIVETDMTGAFLADVLQQNAFGNNEDISLIHPVPEPCAVMLVGFGLVWLIVFPRTPWTNSQAAASSAPAKARSRATFW